MKSGVVVSGFGLWLMSCSIEPRPPNVPGVTWQRHQLAIPIQEATTPRATLRGRRNLFGPYLLEGRDFRYRVAIEVETPQSKTTITCTQTGEKNVPYRCDGDGALKSFEMDAQCQRGLLKVEVGDPKPPMHQLVIDAWYAGQTYVGFLVRDGGRLVAAIDMDHQWEYPVWTDGRRTTEQLLQLDILTVVLADMHSVQESGGYPFLCPEIESRRRFPR